MFDQIIYRVIYGCIHPIEHSVKHDSLITLWEAWYKGPWNRSGLEDALSIVEIELKKSSNMVIFGTATGLIGLVQDGIRAGDIVCVLKGGNVLSLLRKYGDAGHFSHVCTCHVVGFIHGSG
jgi:hypothetical protein